MNLLRLLLISLLICSIGYSQTNPSAPVVYSYRSSAIIKRLESQGINKIGELDLAELKEQLPEIQWRSKEPREDKPNFMGNRSSAYYIRQNKTVTVIADPREHLPEAVDVLSLHESLGALGYEDNDYQKSLSLHILSLAGKNNKWVKQSSDLVNSSARKEKLKARGGTSVGGGGDLVGVTVKLKVLQDLMHRYAMYNSFFYRFSQMPFEPNYDAEMKNFNYSLASLSGCYSGGVEQPCPARVRSIEIPAHRWVTGTTEDRDKLVKDISDLIFSYASVGLLPEILPASCRRIPCKP